MSNAYKRQSNIELCRLLSILLVMLVHTTNQSLGNDMSLGALMLEGFSIVGVNVFILITGNFSTVPKKTSLFNLAFICLFWMVIKVICRFAFNEPITIKHLFFITSSNWFISSYIGLLFLTPILNLFCNTVRKKRCGIVSYYCYSLKYGLTGYHQDLLLKLGQIMDILFYPLPFFICWLEPFGFMVCHHGSKK